MRGENRLWLFRKCAPLAIRLGLDLQNMPGLGE